ncbi:MAG: ribosome silencing factor [Rhodocyclaceae bacterium]|jgi:ribosome-associated protein|nr:ribosome silencing factor [Rhodocyclaceae bacterium]MCL4758109.1 ribosome silencing factor [Rhodocyclaceae bacterium]
MELKKLEKIVVAALEEIKGENITVLNTSRLTPLFDRVVVASAQSGRQTRALGRNVQERVREAGGEVIGVEGEETGEWILIDLADIVVHVMQPAIREYYKLEEMWTAVPATRRRSAATPARPHASPE